MFDVHVWLQTATCQDVENEIKKLREALIKYGMHDHNCHNPHRNQLLEGCICGFKSATSECKTGEADAS